MLQPSKLATPLTRTPPPCEPQERGQSPQGQWRICQGRFTMQALTYCDAKVMSTRTTAGQFKCQFKGANSYSILRTRGAALRQFSGASSHPNTLRKHTRHTGKSAGQAHRSSSVVMDIAAFKVSHCANTDVDATTLQAEKARSASIGAMDEKSEKVQNANTHTLRHQDHEHAHSIRSVQGSVQGGDG